VPVQSSGIKSKRPADLMDVFTHEMGHQFFLGHPFGGFLPRLIYFLCFIVITDRQRRFPLKTNRCYHAGAPLALHGRIANRAIVGNFADGNDP